jgi:hypothetical protein
MEIFKCFSCTNHFELDDITIIGDLDYCYGCLDVCIHCGRYHNLQGNYCYYCMEGELFKY